MSTLQRSALTVLVALLLPASAPYVAPDPLPRAEVTASGPLGEAWVPRTSHITASQVRLGALGAHTHANWVLFRLPFDTTSLDRVRNVQFAVAAAAETNVGALRIGSICSPMRAYGPIEQWTQFTVGGVAGTDDFGDHPTAPTTDPTLLGIAVPTRVANYVACGWDAGVLASADAWALDVTWDEI